MRRPKFWDPSPTQGRSSITGDARESALPFKAKSYAAAFTLAVSSAAHANQFALADLSLEQLSNLEITSVSRQPERLATAPASIYVITNDDIRRAGVTTLPEALRLAPNLQVARLGAASYAISARGFNNALGNKLLVLIDGRTVYS
ncbi:MAG TPA: TonB-dependent receptor plug domain-containing protein, partial [Burkholderiales bacterium]|nr:TonB-dependent receptor plug domain-containing protein [Burkholderiales bacterium]